MGGQEKLGGCPVGVEKRSPKNNRMSVRASP